MPVTQDQTLWTTKEVAERFKVSEETVRRYIRTGRLKAIQFGESYRITEEALQEFLNKRQRKEK